MNRFYITFFLACCPLVFAQMAPAQNALPAGNLRDPLNAYFGTAGGTRVPPVKSPFTETFGDARLNDVYFISPTRGWAVGDRGVVWTTFDGGANWQLQTTPIDCTLRSVQFFDESFGIAVGNYWFPPTHQGRGVILITRDGGMSWQLRHTPDLPPLYRVKIFDATTILVAGATSEYCPSGLLVSPDGGQTWQPISAQLSDGFAAADFYAPRWGVGIGFHGILQQFQNDLSASQTVDFGHRRVSALKVHRAPQSMMTEFDITGWAVGDRGLILSTVDQGFRWGVVPGTLPGNAADVIDLYALDVYGRNLWVAGNPGSCIYMSHDGGQTWRATFTGISAAIRKIMFVDENTGWAVGDLGTILTTQNGGQTWNIQRTGSTKLSVLGLFGEAEAIPFEVLADLSANRGFLSGCVLLFRNQRNSSEQQDRFHEAVLRSGGSIGTELGTFPILPKELWTTSERLIEHIQQTTDGRGMAQLQERLVAAIRQWKPEVLLTSNYTNPYTDSAIEDLTMREVKEAVQLAADPTAYTHHLTELGLAPWTVKKVYVTLKNNALGDVHLTPGQPAARLGMPLEELTFVSRSLIGAERSPPILGFVHSPAERPESNSTGKDFFAGIQFTNNDGRRQEYGIYADFQEAQRRRAMQRRNVLGMLQSAANTPQTSAAQTPAPVVNRTHLATHALDLTRRLDPDAAVQVLLNMAEQFHQEGDWHAAEETYLILTKNYAPHPLSRLAFLRLMHYAASEEIMTGEFQSEGATVEVTEWIEDPRRPGHRIEQRKVVTKEPIQLWQRMEQQTDRALSIGQFLDQNIPDLANEVSMRFALASVLRRNGLEQESARFYQTRSHARFDDVWGMRARTEFWLTIPDKSALPAEQQELPMPAMVAAYSGIKPYLDGKFDEENDRNVWQQSQLYPLTPATPRRRLAELLQENPERRVGMVREERLRSKSQDFGTQVMFLHDAEHWYIALRCPKVPGADYSFAENQQRLRDTGSADQDRVEILIDPDRDYSTYYSFTIDSRGWITDASLGNRSWNPQWQTARQEDESAWYIEAAIPFSALSQRPMLPNTVWNIAIRRLVPGVGIECWNVENSFELNEGFGLLVFP